MLQLTPNDIHLGQSQSNKQDAIRAIAAHLSEKGLVDAGYVEGMLNREAQNSTFLGNGIAIPHGTTDTRSLVKQTGVAVHHFPQGVDWGDGNTVYVAIGIAAKSDEHLGILKQLTKVLSADGVEQRLQQSTQAQEIIALLNGDVQFEADFDDTLIQLQFPASDMTQLSAVASGLLKNKGCVDGEFVADVIAKDATPLGNGLWLTSSRQGVSRTGLALITANDAFDLQGQSVKGLIVVAACNGSHQPLMQKVSEIVFQKNQQALFATDKQAVLAAFGLAESAPAAGADSSANTAIFQVKNPHGLHARPGAMLVAEAKKFEASIKVANLDGDGKAVNAKSLMKVIALGVKCGHKLEFTADGPDAGQALEALGAAIDAGLGEQ
ncbi:fused PTS fructose transporter subunit IIA/HPr protein [Vibrio mangrovi]|uniref:Multiphosphoryl transfer protein n=1 Tax=Vibrio mangrovi TaxID=474394 RepID=A0A1Y6IYK4_9VIBR|nr:fused PTS fructose transporter subunit IIA/HPr protein [Vibrio mangrovi]MDW6005457.1 fused PTS fructose transporter subunit IIA/HPr protein [Vibrio mangrovi]SMS02101.1 Multiphosphoryl transfer protein [Vibrio mangrovi]